MDIYEKGSRVICEGCFEPIFTLNREMVQGEMLLDEDLTPIGIQKVGRNGLFVKCSHCTTDVFFSIIFKPENSL